MFSSKRTLLTSLPVIGASQLKKKKKKIKIERKAYYKCQEQSKGHRKHVVILRHLIIIPGSKKDCLVVTNQQRDSFAPGAADLLSLEGKLPALTKPLLRSDVSRDLFPSY